MSSKCSAMFLPRSGASAAMLRRVQRRRVARGLFGAPVRLIAEVNSCAAARLLVPAGLIGLVVATVTGVDLAGWIVAALTVVVLVVLERLSGARSTWSRRPVPVAPNEPR